MVIPGRAEGADPESITTTLEYGFRARSLRSRPGMTRIGASIRLSIPMGHADAVLVAGIEQIVVGIMRMLARRAGADLKVDSVARRFVHQHMAVGDAGFPAGRLTRLEQCLPAVFDQGQLAFEHVDEFVLLLVPVPQRRRHTRRQPGPVDAKLSEPGEIAEDSFLAALDRFLELLRIAASAAHLSLGDVELGHQTRSIMVAVPMPTPMHNVMSAVS